MIEKENKNAFMDTEFVEAIDESCDEEIETYKIEDYYASQRLDYFLSLQFDNMSRSYMQKLIREGNILVNSKVQKASYKLQTGDKVELSLPKAEPLEIKAQNIDLDIIYEDDDLLIVNKAQGMVVHPAPGNYDSTMVNALMYHCGDRLSNINGVIRPGIVHRIDKDTSGLLVVAKNNNAHQKLSNQFKVHSITREYEMICMGNVDWDEKTIETLIARNPKDRLKMAVVKNGGKKAITHLKTISLYRGYCHIKANLETGRTHQIRVHTASINHPILGDPIYGYKNKKFSKLKGQVLHARKLGFIHPRSGEYIEFSSDLPEYFKDILEILEKE